MGARAISQPFQPMSSTPTRRASRLPLWDAPGMRKGLLVSGLVVVVLLGIGFVFRRWVLMGLFVLMIGALAGQGFATIIVLAALTNAVVLIRLVKAARLLRKS